MRKKRGVKLTKQLNVRVSESIYTRVDRIAFKLDVDPSDVVRMLLAEHLEEHEQRLKIPPLPVATSEAHQ